MDGDLKDANDISSFAVLSAKAKGSFNNYYVDQILPNFDPPHTHTHQAPLEWTKLDIPKWGNGTFRLPKSTF